ncbi:MAG: tetratricopeptide repeat protein, partial [Deltaproteobacteria bacterium]|nr:tetratricopeptide repeat protein [Deltaproteobacteria bacterium]
GDVASALTVGSLAAGQSLSLAYSRDDERQADQVGLKYLNDSGYTGDGLLKVLKKIKETQWYGDLIPDYLKTHPGTDERIIYISNRSEKPTPVDPAIRKRQVQDFQRAKIRLMALYGDTGNAAARFNALLEKDPGDASAHLGYGLLAERTGDRNAAKSFLKKALEKQAFDPYLLTDLGRIYFKNGEFESALKTLKSAAGIGPDIPETLLALGRTQLAMGMAPEAERSIRKILNDRPNHLPAIYELSKVYGEQGKMAHAHYHLAHFYAEIGNLRKAMLNLKQAKKQATEPEIKEKIEAAIKKTDPDFKKLQKKQKEQREQQEQEQEQQRQQQSRRRQQGQRQQR